MIPNFKNFLENNVELKNHIIFFCFFFFIFFWDLSASYNKIFDARILIFFPFCLYLYEKIIFFKIDKREIYSFISILIITLHLLINLIFFENLFSYNYYFVSVVSLIILTFVVQRNLQFINENLEKFCLLFCFFSVLFLFGQFLPTTNRFVCRILEVKSKLFDLFFLENSHFALMSVPTILFISYTFEKKVKKINLIFLSLMILINAFIFTSTTGILSLIILSFFFLVFFYRKISYKLKYILFFIFFFHSAIFLTLHGCHKKISDILLYRVIKDNQNLELYLDRYSKYLPKYFIGQIYQNINIDKEIRNNKIVREKIIRNQNLTSSNNLSQTRYNVVDLSTQVALNSYQVALGSLFKRPLGFGFNNYENAFASNLDARVDNYSVDVSLINKKDASSSLSKLVSEFGILSVIFFIYLFIFLISKKIDNKYKFFYFSLIFTQLIRGVGYFNGGFLLSFLIIIYLIHEKK